MFIIILLIWYVYLNLLFVDKKFLDFVFGIGRIFYVRYKVVGGIRVVCSGDFSICQRRYYNGGIMG